MKNGALSTLKDDQGKTPKGIATRLGFHEIVSLFDKFERGPSDEEGFDHTPASVEEVDASTAEENEKEEEEEEEVIEL